MRPYKAAQYREARRLRAAGWSLRRIAVKLDVSISTVSRWVRDIAVPAIVSNEKAERRIETPTGETRRCGRCRRDLPLEAFNRHPRGRQWWCRDCYREYFRARGAHHVQQVHEARRRRRRAALRVLEEHLRASACTDCGEADAAVLEFHHLGAKRGNVTTLAWDGLSVAALRREIDACEVVCVNCHRRRTARRGSWWRLRPEEIDESPDLLPGERRNVALVRDHLLSSGCVDCGIRDLIVLDFDHTGEKRGNVVVLARRGLGHQAVRAEIERSVVRCANCHRRRHRRGANTPVGS
jgi:Homeodomain-like domain